ncbi:restriction endonuclease subunit S [Glutamicibacter sp. V16R2B1]|uniref:restriction endonuclease subunit S n=1 Tax=Glutamicibacter sp. V16R2B1 TaxID=2036207 RepID=UPI0010FF6224|nr:restriction endonuclease subunit S [Glutamicibacter sp. V16R2B1]TLK50912.1 restriction endonuclease subunit S [Glutamicibacter sp. V16R2B1]
MSRVTLGEAFILNPTVKLSKGTHAPFVDMASLVPFTRNVSATQDKPYGGGMKFCDGDVLMARITPSLENGKTSVYRAAANQRNAPAFGSTEFIVIRGKEGISSTSFAYYLFTSPEIRDYAISSMNGSSGRQRVQHDSLDSFEIDLPELEEQRAIAATLGALDDKIESNRREIGTLQQLGDAIFAASSNESRLLSDVADITMGSSPKGADLNEHRDGLPFYQGTRDFGFRFPTLRVWTTAPVRTAAKNDTLMSVRAPVGELNRAHADCCIGRGVAAIHSETHPSTLYYAMRNSTSAWNKFQGEGTVFASVNKTDVHSAEVRWVGDDVTLELEERLHAIDVRIESLEEESRRLAALRDTLLPELLSGRVRVPIEGDHA